MSESPAAVLRKAAARVRETGAACESSVISLRGVPWHTEKYAVDLSPRAVAQSAPSSDERARVGRYIAEAESPKLAAWIALMHPGLAEPLAAWLSDSAEFLDGVTEAHGTVTELALHNTRHQLAIARIILGAPKETIA